MAVIIIANYNVAGMGMFYNFAFKYFENENLQSVTYIL